MKIRVTKNLLIKALGKLSLSDEEKNRLLEYISTAKTGFAEIETQRFSAALMSYILKNSPNMASKAKAQLSTQLFNESSIEEDDKFEVWNTSIKQLADIVECFSRIGTKQPNADVFFNKTWFPVVVIPSFSPGSRYSDACVTFAIKITFAKEYVDIGFTVVRKHLLNNRGGIRKISLKELLREFGCRPLQCDLIQHEDKLTRTSVLSKQNVQMLCYGYVISDLKNNRSEVLGYKSAKERVIIESELEYDISRTRQAEVFDEDWWPLPFLRVFSFFLKRYVFVNVDDLSEYVYNTEAMKRLFLPSSISSLLKTVFAAPIESLVGDILDNKHGGMIILAAGSPGVGKTSTAEVYSELQSIPLYALEISELGTYVDSIEKHLSVIFKRVEKWRAVILFDEVDIFLAKRDKNDLNRTAIVGVFLRLMDYFRGIMFLTSNRPETLDYAIHSRITLRVNYPDLDKKTREAIWKDKLSKAHIPISDGYSKLAELELNGRNIRNITRLAAIVFPNGTTQDELIQLIDMTNPINALKENMD